MNGKTAAILGVGPGLGSAVARREESVSGVRQEIEEGGGAAFEKVRGELGDPEVFVYNAGAFQMGGILDVSPEKFDECFKANCAGAFYAARQALPAMVEAGSGIVLLTGATVALRGGARFSALAVGKFGLRALAQSMAREFGPQGIHVAHVVVDGQIDTPRVRGMSPGREDHTMLSPDSIAETYWLLHKQDPTAWTLEMDLRPAVESF